MSSGGNVNASAAAEVNFAGPEHELLDLVSALICLLRDGRIIFLNKAGIGALGLKNAEQALGRELADFVGTDDRYLVEAGWDLLAGKDVVPLKLLQSSGVLFSVEMRVGRIPGADETFLVEARDISRFDQEAASGLLFGYDPLTGLPDRNLFADRISQAVLQANRIGASVALMIMDLDLFSLVNDALGQAAGDSLLIEVARRIKMGVRETDTVVRLDGDRFGLVMAIAGVEDSVNIAEKILRVVKEPFHIDGQEVVATLSIGISVLRVDADAADQLTKNAEHALHFAKTSGRNQYQFFSKDMNRKARARLELETRMRRALANEEFIVYYQPKVSIDSDTIVGAEALVRWLDPEKGIVSPGEFIPVAEETGQIEAIGNWVLLKSCEQNKVWQDMGLAPIKVSVNVSARQFRSRSLHDTVVDILARTRLDPAWLELEITESMLMNDVDMAVRKMTALRDLGVGLSIDDFGTGYSSLSYLGQFPITTLKIDRAFIADVETNPKTAEIARAIIGLSRGLNLQVVAEGAEVAAQVRFLTQNGCDTVQGFYYSRPVPADDFERMMRLPGMARG